MVLPSNGHHMEGIGRAVLVQNEGTCAMRASMAGSSSRARVAEALSLARLSREQNRAR